MSETRTEERLGKLETEFAIVKNDLTAIGHSLAEFRGEWAKKAEDDRAAHRSDRLMMPQIVAMLGTAVVVTGAFLGGLMYLVNTQVGAARGDLTGQMQAMRADFTAQVGAARQSAEASSAQVALAVRGQGDSVTAANTAIQATQRDQGEIKVKLGLVEQQSAASARFIEQAQSFDAQMARHEERQRAFAEALRTQEILLREIASRKPPS